MANKLWGGRFSKKTNPLVEEFTKSIHYDYKLALYDVLGSIAHVQVLKKAGYLTAKEATKLTKGLKSILNTDGKGTFEVNLAEEDIHTHIQNALYKKVGDVALKLHTARSRNDQVVVVTKLYCKDAIRGLKGDIAALEGALLEAQIKNKEIILPGLTHTQHAQPVSLEDYTGAYIEMLERDAKRLDSIARDIAVKMGAGALAGTPIEADLYNIKELGIGPVVNSLDAVSDRDFVVEILSALAIIGMHLSRIAEDLIMWSTKEFNFIELDESFCTGSSLMPQKKNPDALELIRGYAGRLNGNLVSVLTMMKGLPLAYNRDMQLDKEPLFNSIEIVSAELKVLSGLIKTLKFNKETIDGHLQDESLYATDLVYYLVDKGVPFKTAHTMVGKLVRYSIDNDIPIKDMTEPELKVISDKFVKKEIIRLFDPVVSVKSKKSIKR